MACENDAGWEGATCSVGSCVTWSSLTALRNKYNTLWDIVDREPGRATEWKYGFAGLGQNTKKEEVSPLAAVTGFFSVRFDRLGEIEHIYFLHPPGGDLGIRLASPEYNYHEDPVYGPWIVYLTDPCFGCTGFGLQAIDLDYYTGSGRTVTCGNSTYNIDPVVMKGQCIWNCGTQNTSSVPAGLCNFNFDWRSMEGVTRLQDLVKYMFPKTICVEWNAPCDGDVKPLCCDDVEASARYTEEWNVGDECGAPSSGMVQRKLKYVSLGIGAFEGYATQVIKAVHLTKITDRISTMLDGQPMRRCYYNQCKYYQAENKKYRWVQEETVPTTGIDSIAERKDGCNYCDPASAGTSICACQFNDLNATLDEYIGMTCLCVGGTKKGSTLISVGDLSTCDCCKGKCCCDCKCEEELTEEECLKKTCTKAGPTWTGIYKSRDDYPEKFGDKKPCGCYEAGDKDFPDTSCMEVCGKVAACCYDNDGSCCELLTKCECTDKGGTWHGFRTSDGSYKSSTWAKGDPKLCSDEDIQEIENCGRVSACCLPDTCTCESLPKCVCESRGGTWKGLDGSGQSRLCSEFTDTEADCGATGACCGGGYCRETTRCDCYHGFWHGANSVCSDYSSDSECVGDQGACCESGTCSQDYESSCVGSFKGVGTLCSDYSDDPECGNAGCGVCDNNNGWAQINPDESGNCQCCPGETGGYCDDYTPCCCCGWQYRPQKFGNICICVYDPTQ